MERLALDRWASPWLRHQHVMRYRWAARFTRGLRVLDAACGTGYGSRLLRDEGALHVTSLDLASEAFEGARRIGAAPILRLARADVTALPLRDGVFDAYVCFETIEHVADDHALLREAKRVLKPEGTFLCSTPNRDLLSPGHSLRDRPENPYHVREYSISELAELLGRFFSSVELFGQTWFSEAHRHLLWRTGERSPHFAVRLHQIRNILGIPWERPERHVPAALDGNGVPEVILALCTS